MINIPSVNEIRQIRCAYAERFKNDLYAIFEDLKRQEQESDREFRTHVHANVDRTATQTYHFLLTGNFRYENCS